MPYDMLDSDVGDPGMNTIKSTVVVIISLYARVTRG